MQIEAGIPPELIDVLQATILLFLVAGPVLAPGLPARAASSGGLERTDTITRSYGGEATSA